MSLDGCLPTFFVIAGRAGGDKVIPGMGAAHPPGLDVIDGQFACFVSAILTGEIIPAENFRFGQFDCRTGAFDHIFEPDDGRGRIKVGDCFDVAAPVFDQACLL